MDHAQELRQTFLVETEELIGTIESGLMALEENPARSETVHAVFRAAHTIKSIRDRLVA